MNAVDRKDEYGDKEWELTLLDWIQDSRDSMQWHTAQLKFHEDCLRQWQAELAKHRQERDRYPLIRTPRR